MAQPGVCLGSPVRILHITTTLHHSMGSLAWPSHVSAARPNQQRSRGASSRAEGRAAASPGAHVPLSLSPRAHCRGASNRPSKQRGEQRALVRLRIEVCRHTRECPWVTHATHTGSHGSVSHATHNLGHASSLSLGRPPSIFLALTLTEYFTEFHSAHLRRCDLTSSPFHSPHLRRSDVISSPFHSPHLRRSDLISSPFHSAHLRRSDLISIQLRQRI